LKFSRFQKIMKIYHRQKVKAPHPQSKFVGETMVARNAAGEPSGWP
jgi:hypothetical protein